MERYQQWKAKPLKEQTRFNALVGVGNLEHKLKQLVKKLFHQS